MSNEDLHLEKTPHTRTPEQESLLSGVEKINLSPNYLKVIEQAHFFQKEIEKKNPDLDLGDYLLWHKIIGSTPPKDIELEFDTPHQDVEKFVLEIMEQEKQRNKEDEITFNRMTGVMFLYQTDVENGVISQEAVEAKNKKRDEFIAQLEAMNINPKLSRLYYVLMNDMDNVEHAKRLDVHDRYELEGAGLIQRFIEKHYTRK